jgi:integrase
MPARPHGAGSIYQRGDGLWVATLDVSSVGARDRRYLYGTTRKAVVAKLKAAQQQLAAGQVPTKQQRLAVFLTTWLATVAPRVRPSTYERYTTIVDKYLTPGLGRVVLSELTPAQVHAFLTQQAAAGTGARTVQQCHSVLRAALNQALRWGAVPRNVATLVDAPRAVPAERPVLTVAQAQALLVATQAGRWGPLWCVALLTGLRRGELLGLRWADVDLDAATLRVTGALSRDRERTAPKTARALRTVPLAPPVVVALRTQRQWARLARVAAGSGWTDTGYVFTTPTGSALRGDNVHRAWDRTLVRLGLPGVRFHDLRHTCASLLLTAGTPPRVVMAILGHTTPDVTLGIYAHVQQGDLTAALERLAGLLAADTG